MDGWTDWLVDWLQFREEAMQPSMDPCGGPSAQKPGGPPATPPAWMVHAETQTCSSSQAPMWADEQFAFLELSRPPGHARDEEECIELSRPPGHAGEEEEYVQPHAKQRSWSKVEACFAAVCIENRRKDCATYAVALYMGDKHVKHCPPEPVCIYSLGVKGQTTNVDLPS